MKEAKITIVKTNTVFERPEKPGKANEHWN